jgi:hypothetical protein
VTHGDQHYFTTFTGRRFWPLDPRAEDIDIRDIARALSMICRFNGHVRAFYSVAQHSVIVSHHVSPDYALYGLLHDAAEAYMGDMSSELKHSSAMAEYRLFEDALKRTIYHRYGLNPYGEPSGLKTIDRALLQDEIREVALNAGVRQVYCQGPGLGITITPWEPAIAERRFLERFDVLTNF